MTNADIVSNGWSLQKETQPISSQELEDIGQLTEGTRTTYVELSSYSKNYTPTPKEKVVYCFLFFFSIQVFIIQHRS